MKSSDIHIRAISQEMPHPSIIKIRLKSTYLKFHSNFPGAKELTSFSCDIWRPLLPIEIRRGNSKCRLWLCDHAPVPLSIFRSNSKFDENSECSSFEYTRPITTTFCTRHDSDTVVTCAKYRCDRPRIFYTRVFWIFIEFRIRSKYA